MEYRSLGRTGVMVSRLALGCAMFGGRTRPHDAAGIIDHALDAGINFIDTANFYYIGRSEEAVGAALERNGRRQEIVLATKVYNPMGERPNERGLSRRHIVEACEASLRRLKTEYIDLYQLHRPMPEIPIDETLRALDDLIRSGKVRYIGTSNFSSWQLMESLWASKEHGLHRFISEQPGYNLLDRRIERELVPMARTYGVGILPFSPLAAGQLTGKYDMEGALPPGSRASSSSIAPSMERQWKRPVFEAIELLRGVVAQRGVPMSQFVLAWVAAQPGVTAPIIGPRTMEQLVDNLKALDFELTPEELAAVDAIFPPGSMMASYYEGPWGPHPHRW